MFRSTIAIIMLVAFVKAQNMTDSPDDMMVNTTMMASTSSVPVDTMPSSSAPDTTTTGTDAPPTSTTTQTMETTTDVPCNISIGRLDEVYAFTSMPAFADIPVNEQIVVYEVLAAAEGCTMATFITPGTTERIFRMLGSLPVRYVYVMLKYMAEALANEGVVIPV